MDKKSVLPSILSFTILFSVLQSWNGQATPSTSRRADHHDLHQKAVNTRKQTTPKVTYSNIVATWNSTAIQIFRELSFNPPITARALAMMNTAMYDAWASYNEAQTTPRSSLFDQLEKSNPSTADQEKAISFAAYRILLDLFPNKKSNLDGLMQQRGYDLNNTSLDPKTPAGLGNAIAQKLLEFRHNDGANQLGNLCGTGEPYTDYTGYKSINTPTNLIDPNQWQPQMAKNAKGIEAEQEFLLPQWHKVAPFALNSASQFRAQLKKPARFKTPEFLQQSREVYQLSQRITPQQKAIAQFWISGPQKETTPGIWHLFALKLSQQRKHTLEQDIKLFFALANANFDAGIAAWDTKLAYNSVRPITAIRMLIDPKWEPYIPTPPFSEFVSGHSTLGAASAEILRSFFGSDKFAQSHVEPQTGTKLYWPTFSSAADEAGMSRLYGGIHFKDGDLEGRKLGRLAGKAVWQKTSALFQPKSQRKLNRS
jgi:PAP2 superfamily